MIAACPLCAAPAPPPFLDRAHVPVHQNRTADSAEAARAMPRGRLAMAACAACGFVFNRAFDPALPAYGPGYDNAQSHSAEFAAHLDGRVRHLVQARGLRGARIVEVGCGQGDFLHRLAAAGNTGAGYDPAYRGPARAADGALRFEPRVYGPDTAGPADAVVCRHVIEHVADPLALLRAIRTATAAPVYFETPDIGWILRHAVPWDLFYEHCSLFSQASLTFAFARAGYAVTAADTVFGGQYLWLEARPAAPDPCPQAGDIPALASGFAAREAALIAAWRAQLAALTPVALWGAGAKGATLAALADPDAALIAGLVDINRAKQGRFIAGSGHRIVAPDDLAPLGVRHVLAMNPAYHAEIAALLPPGVARAEWAA